MKFDVFLDLVRRLPWFDLHMLMQAFPEERASIKVQLSRWMKQGKVIGLRRGMYALEEKYRAIAVTGPTLANHLYTPSYLSGVWAMGFYDLIPEHVAHMTSVTSRVPRRFSNAFGEFEYQNVHQRLFRGYQTEAFGGATILVARPEKALLDHWHLTPGEWTSDRLVEMRYQNTHHIAESALREWGTLFRSPRLDRAIDRWLALVGEDDTDVVIP